MIDHFASVGWIFVSDAIILPDFGADHFALKSFPDARDAPYFAIILVSENLRNLIILLSDHFDGYSLVDRLSK